MSNPRVQQASTRQQLRGKSRIPVGSMFFERIVPLLLAVMGVVMLLLILFAAGVLLGLIKF